MRYFDTFSGIGGFPLGIIRAHENTCAESKEGDTHYGDMRVVANNEKLDTVPVCVGYSEIDKYAASIYQKHFPYEQCEDCRLAREREYNSSSHERQEAFDLRGACLPQNHRDINNINISSPAKNNCECRRKPYGDITKIIAEDLPDFDLLVGGVPCQSWSIAGKRLGFEDERGNMWFQYARILRAKRPKYFIAENVKGLLSHDGGKSMERVCEELCSCGYAIDFEVLNSKNHGVPQSRERVFIIGVRLDLLDAMQIF
jgi:site-specific DNA-cytosine methylase